MSEIYFVRHTKVSNPEALCYGRHDIGLAETYPDELARIRQALPLEWSRVYSSPAQRCSMLASELGGEAPQLDERLYEINFGDWEGRPWKKLPKEETISWTDNIVTHRPPRGESYQEMADRAASFQAEIIAGLMPGERLLIITHKGILWTILAHQLGLDLKAALRIEIPYGAIYRFIYSPPDQEF